MAPHDPVRSQVSAAVPERGHLQGRGFDYQREEKDDGGHGHRYRQDGHDILNGSSSRALALR